MRIRRIEICDINGAAQVHEAVFPRQLLSKEWIESNVRAYPRVYYFIAENDENRIVGFIHWIQKSGFRQQVVLELEQIGVLPECQGGGLGTRLISETLRHIQADLEHRQASLKHIMVTTRADNSAQRLYRKVLGAEIEATLTDLYSADEVVMIARNVDILPVHLDSDRKIDRSVTWMELSSLRQIGEVQGDILTLEDAPKNYSESRRVGTLEIRPEYQDGLDGIEVGQTIVVLFWLHESKREILKVHPRGNTSNPLRGVFSTRSPVRPNPIAISELQVLAVNGNSLRVSGLDVLNGTPIIDVKKKIGTS